MDPNIWGALKTYEDLLKIIYTKMPIQDFFRLRLVCKDWNEGARDREFLEQTYTTPIAKPHFVVMHPRGVVQGLLYRDLDRDAVSHRWNWTRLPIEEPHHCDIVEEKGLIHSFNKKECHHEVFNVHTRVRHVLPPLAGDSEPQNGLTGLRVIASTSVIPSAFEVLVTKPGVSTHIYDSVSNSWSLKCTQNVPVEEVKWHGRIGYEIPFGLSTSAECNGVLYLVAQTLRLYTYHVESHVWGTLEPSPRSFDGLGEVIAPIGAWQDRLFFVTEANQSRNNSISVWELVHVDHSRAEWTDLDHRRMPKEILSSLYYGDDQDSAQRDRDRIYLRSSFCYEYVLVYAWDLDKGFAERYVMCNLDTKKWEQLRAPLQQISRNPVDPDPEE